MERITVKIDGMTCGNCVAHVSKALEALAGVHVEQVQIGTATVSFDPESTSGRKISKAIEDEGYTVASVTG